MNSLPTLPRVWLLAIVWGAGCGAALGASALLVSALIDLGDFTAFGVVVGIPLLAAYAAVIGGILGSVIGVPTGLVAGLTLEASLRSMTPRAATWTTVTVVLGGQVVAEIAIVEVPSWSTVWAFCVVPAIAAFPLARVAGNAARDSVAPRIAHRDTLAA